MQEQQRETSTADVANKVFFVYGSFKYFVVFGYTCARKTADKTASNSAGCVSE